MTPLAWLDVRRRRRRGGPVEVRVYTRTGCGLCREAERTVVRLAKGSHVELIDVDAHAELTDRYTVRVPVVEVDGVEASELGCDAAVLRRHLEEARDRRVRSLVP